MEFLIHDKGRKTENRCFRTYLSNLIYLFIYSFFLLFIHFLHCGLIFFQEYFAYLIKGEQWLDG